MPRRVVNGPLLSTSAPLFLLLACHAEPATLPSAPGKTPASSMSEPAPSNRAATASASAASPVAPPGAVLAPAQSALEAGRFDEAARELRKLEARVDASEGQRAEARLELFKAWLKNQEQTPVSAVCQEPASPGHKHAGYPRGTLRDSRGAARALLSCALSAQGGLDAGPLATLLGRIDALDVRDRKACAERGLRAQIDVQLAVMTTRLGPLA